MSKYSEWLNKNLGKKIDFDGNYGAQCFDWFNRYAVDLFGVPKTLLFAHSYAYQLYTNFNMGEYFTKIANTPDFVPQVGDVCIWDKSLNGYAGHVAIATGEGNVSTFWVTEQNTDGTATKPSAKVKRNYNHFLGVLRPKDQNVFKNASTTSKLKTKPAIGTILVPDTYVLTADQVNVRSGAGTNYKAIKTLAKGTSVYISEFKYVGTQTWGKINGGWICVNNNSVFYIRVYGTVQGDGVNVRKTAGGKVCGSVKKGVKLLLTKEDNGWGYAPSVGGWVSLAYVK